jgi:hypothetical protein
MTELSIPQILFGIFTDTEEEEAYWSVRNSYVAQIEANPAYQEWVAELEAHDPALPYRGRQFIDVLRQYYPELRITDDQDSADDGSGLIQGDRRSCVEERASAGSRPDLDARCSRLPSA